MPGFLHSAGGTGQSNHPARYMSRAYEPFVYGSRGDTSLIKQGMPNVLTYPGVLPTEKQHDVQKPLALMEDLVSRVCLPGHTILDPMAGSATTLIAGVKRGCNVIGFEIDKDKHNAGILRLSEALKIKDGGMLNELGD